MEDGAVLVEVRRGEDGRIEVRSPGVGFWARHPRAGSLVGSGSVVGTLERLNRKVRLLLPEATAGRVTGTLPRLRSVPVEYGELLFELRPVEEGDRFDADDAAGVAAGVAAGAHAVVSPTDGVFYRGPSPDAPPFVQAGALVRAGQVLGLVEVMKTFNPIRYGGPGFPEQARVEEIRAGDGQEVRAGEVLLVVR